MALPVAAAFRKRFRLADKKSESPAPTAREGLHLQLGQTLHFRHRLIAYLGKPDREKLDRLYRQCCGR